MSNEQKQTVMKTKRQKNALANLKLLIVLPVIAISILGLSSCGKARNTETASNELAPPPPPTPPPAPSVDEIYVNVDEMPLFEDGDSGLLKYIKNNTTYPEDAKKKNIQGRVLIKFVVEKDCSVSQVEVLEGVNPILDAEALRVVKSLPNFEKPAKKTGESVRVSYMLPIIFALK
jgi:TonB family protein